MHFLHGETLGRDAGRHAIAVGHTGRSPVARELPGVKRALDAVLADTAVPEVRPEVGAEGAHRMHVVRVFAAPHDQCAAETLEVAHLSAPKRL